MPPLAWLAILDQRPARGLAARRHRIQSLQGLLDLAKAGVDGKRLGIRGHAVLSDHLHRDFREATGASGRGGYFDVDGQYAQGVYARNSWVIFRTVHVLIKS